MKMLLDAVAGVVQDVFKSDVSPELTRTSEQFGDYTTNVAMQLAGRLKRNPREIAAEVAAQLRVHLGDAVQSVEIAGPGFINITLSDAHIYHAATQAAGLKPTTMRGKIIVCEYSDPNPFKVLHVGHLYTSVVGYAIGSLFEAAGGVVHRVNFGGDVGLHVGKTMWAMLQELGGANPEKLQTIAPNDRAEWMARCYIVGTNAYEDNEQAKAEIVDLNKQVYGFHANDDHTAPLAQIYWTCRTWSYDYFDAFYERIGTPFEKYYPESECADIGLAIVREQLAKGVYSQSDGAVIFKGEEYGLHTRVFINSHGVPTYEAKDVGLIMRKWQDYHFDRSIVITDNGQAPYMAVVLKSVEQFNPELVQATTHLTHGVVKMKGGVKMSSRKGNILRAVDVLDAAQEANKHLTGRESESAVLAAVKYAFIKQRMGPDIMYDAEESVSLEGNSGPYLQYAHARARSVLNKAISTPEQALPSDGLQPQERSLARKISEYPEVVQQAVDELMPHHICTYLYELAQSFNRFYEHNRVLGDSRESVRLQLITCYADVLRDGLSLLGIDAPDRM